MSPDGAPLSIRDFLTDGSLAALCAELTTLTGAATELRDEHGYRIVAVQDGREPWRALTEEGPAPIPEHAIQVPMFLEGNQIGTIVLDDADLEEPARESVRRVASLLASTAIELCTDVLELRHRVKEIGVLYRLSSLLTARTGVERMLGAALESALEALALDAGSLVLLPKDADGIAARDLEVDVTVSTSRNLSEAWLDSTTPLSRDRLFDRLALEGEVVTVEDLLSDGRVMLPDRCRREDIRGFITAGLVFRGHPIGLIRLYSREPRVFNLAERRLLRSIAQQAAASVEQARLMEMRREEERIQRQLALAVDVQGRMLPRALPRSAGVDLGARCVPSSQLGGDFYDLFETPSGIGIVVGDVVGKGMAAALMMSAVRAALRAHAEVTDDLGEVLNRTNRSMCRDTLVNEFATIWYGMLDPASGELRYCSAGHDPPFVVRADGSVRELEIGGLVVGIDPDHVYEERTGRLDVGDVLIAYTDGMTDARNFDQVKYGKERFHRSVADQANQPGVSADQLADHALWDIKRFAGLSEQTDDETIVIVRKLPI